MHNKLRNNKMYKGKVIVEPIKKKSKLLKVVYGLSALALLNMGTSLYLNSKLKDTKPVNGSQIEQIINDTKEEFKSDKEIHYEIGDFRQTGPIKNEDGSYTIGFDKDNDLKEGIVFHELYHVLAGHVDNNASSSLINLFLEELSYIFLEEPTASIYAFKKSR